MYTPGILQIYFIFLLLIYKIMFQECNITAIVGYFDTYFDLPNPVMFSTGPAVTPTHWKQTIFYMPQPIPVKVDQILKCKIVCKRMKTDARALKIALHVDDLVLKYTVD